MSVKIKDYKLWERKRKVISNKVIGYKDYGLHGSVPQFEALLDCGHTKLFGSTGVLFEFENCTICDKEDV